MGQPTPQATSGQGQASPTLAVLRNRLWQAALALTGSRDDADDLTQQTLATVLSRQPACLEHVGYVRRTMFRLWLDEQRSVGRRARRIARLAAAAATSVRLDEDASDDDVHDRVRWAVESLPPQQHAVAVLRLVEGLGYDEIAGVLECSVATVRANLHLARRGIRRMIGKR